MNKNPREDLSRVSEAATQNVIRLPLGKLKIFNQHDTPPGLLFMQGSCIIEIMFFEGESVPDNMTFEAFQARLAEMNASSALADQEEQPHIGHVKIVDGSGEMLYRFDNNNEENLAIALALSRDRTPLGEFSFAVVNGEFLISPPASTRIGNINGDAAMNKERIRFRCLGDGDRDIDITGLRVEKVTEAGRIPIFAEVFRDLKKQGAEVKVMLWFEPHVEDAG